MEWSDCGGLEGAGLGALEQSSSGARSLPPGGSPALCGGGSEYGGGPLGLVQRHLRRERGLALSIAGPAPPLGDACSPLTPQHPQKGGPWTRWVLNTLLWPQMTKRPPPAPLPRPK